MIKAYSNLVHSDHPTILAVDDCRVTQKLIQKILGKEYQVKTASNAQEALNVSYEDQIDLFILDVSMPEIDGLELCRTLRQLPQFQDSPIVMLTSRDGTFDKVKGKIAGATEYLTKPFNTEELREVIRQVLD